MREGRQIELVRHMSSVSLEQCWPQKAPRCVVRQWQTEVLVPEAHKRLFVFLRAELRLPTVANDEHTLTRFQSLDLRAIRSPDSTDSANACFFEEILFDPIGGVDAAKLFQFLLVRYKDLADTCRQAVLR